MPRKPISFELDFMIKDIFPRFTVKQFDDVSFNIKPKNQGLDYDTTGMTGKIFVGVNNDMFMQTTDITVSNNNINVLLDRNMLQKQGRAYAEVELTDNDGTITSSSFIFDIDPKIGEGGQIPEGYEGFVEKYERLISEFKSQINSTINNCNKSVDNKLNVVDSLINVKISDFEERFNMLTVSQQQDAEVIDARDGETSLKARLDRDIEKAKQVYVELEGNHISTESSTGAIQDIQILGNTVQDPNNLADIKSVGELQEDGTYKMSILSCGKNFNSGLELGGLNTTTGDISVDNTKFRSKNYIKIKPNMDINIKMYTQDLVVNSIFEYDANLKFIKNISPATALSSNCAYIKVQGRHTTNGTDITSILNNNVDLQIEEGTVATPYEPYQENKCDILLPCQLEKVGDVADRLYYDDVEKAWCVEKNVVTKVLNGSEEGWYGVVTGDYFRCTIQNFNVSAKKAGMCDKLKINSRWDAQEKGIFIDHNLTITLPLSEANSIETFKQWLKTNLPVIKYENTTEKFIPLPLDTQIALNSFFGTTHIYMESGEVEGTIKCKVPKSLGATVQSLNNKTDILSDRIEAIEGLKDSQNMKYETDKGYLVCKETKNGVIDDLKIEGKTLVNLAKSVILDGSTNLIKRDLNSKIVTLCCDIKDLQTQLNGRYLFTDGTKGNDFKVASNGFNGFVCMAINCDNVSEGKTVSGIAMYKVSSSLSANVTDLIILEGDHTQNPPSYFEGLMSVGQDVDKIEVSSVNENLFDTDINFDYGNLLLNNKDTARIHTTSRIKVRKNTDYYIKSPSGYLTVVSAVNENNVSIKDLNTGYTEAFVFNTQEYDYIGMQLKRTDNGTIDLPNFDNSLIMFNKGTTPKPYTPHKSDKKQILFYNENGELEPVTELHEWDSIEKHSDNKWYYHKRSGKVVLNGGESWNINNNSTNHMRFSLNVDCKVGTLDVISDKFSYVGDSTTKETIFTYRTNGQNHGVLVICIDKSKLSTQDVQGFKQWLQANNVTVVYQLAEEEVYELAPLHLDSYANETLILCNSGAISPRMEFSITSHINELVKAYGERINLLEEKVYKYMVTQNRMQLASTYSADSVTFKVDYFSLCGDEENYDEDLYNLILNNILVGKDNYDYDKMFTMILDYASWNQISWEQFDILVGLMDMQHNPPVEELPTEDIIEEDIIENEETPVE